MSKTREELFSDEVEAALVASGAVIVRRLPDEFGILAKRGEREFTVFLRNVFQETRDADPIERQARIGVLVSMNVDARDELGFEEAAERLVPLLRPVTMFAAVTARPGGKPVLQRAFAPFLIEAVAVDSPRSMQILNREVVERWGVPPADVFARALANLAAAPTSVAQYDPESPVPIWYVASDDSYESSRLLVPGWLASFAGKVNGRPVAVAPDRAMLLIGGDGDEACLRRLLDAASRQYGSSARSISPAPYTVDDAGNVIPLVLPQGHPLANDVAIAHIKLAMREYEEQKVLLQQSVGDDLFVASYSALQENDTGEVWSYCVWTRGVSSLLPRTSCVMLVDPSTPSEKSKRVDWDAIAPSLVEEPEMAPVRYRTGDWPA